MKNTPKSVAGIGRGTSSITYGQYQTFNENLSTQATIAVFKIIKHLPYASCKKPGHKEEVK
jgi:hypothetical protein